MKEILYATLIAVTFPVNGVEDPRGRVISWEFRIGWPC
jgi:hypothetical protein